jgi:hypothetical protein
LQGGFAAVILGGYGIAQLIAFAMTKAPRSNASTGIPRPRGVRALYRDIQKHWTGDAAGGE